MTAPKVIPIEVPAVTLVGISGQFISEMEEVSDAYVVISGLWKHLGELLGPAFYEVHWSIGVMSPAKDSSKMNYMAAIRLKDSGGQTEGLETLEFPGGSYLACEHVGRVEEMAQTTRWLYGQYLPSSAAQVRDGYHIEIYDDRFDPTSDDSVALIAVPI